MNEMRTVFHSQVTSTSIAGHNFSEYTSANPAVSFVDIVSETESNCVAEVSYQYLSQ